MIVADTDVLIDYLANRQPATSMIREYIDSNHLVTTAISCFELRSGTTDRRISTTRQMIESIPVLALDANAAQRAAEVRRHLESRGQSIGMGDSLIAGVVIVHGGPLFTRNRKHFERVPGLD